MLAFDVDGASGGVVTGAIESSRFTSTGSSGSGDGSWFKDARSSSYLLLRLGQKVQISDEEISHSSKCALPPREFLDPSYQSPYSLKGCTKESCGFKIVIGSETL